MTYRVQITAGPYAFDVTQGDDPATCKLLDPLVISWAYPDDAIYPSQPDPVVLQFSVLAPDASTYPSLILGASVTARLDLAPAGYPVRFLGMITDLTARVHPHGMQYDVIATDATVDLANLTLDPNATAIEPLLQRMAGCFTAAGLSGPADFDASVPCEQWSDGTVPGAAVLMDHHTYDGESLRDALVAVADQFGGVYAAPRQTVEFRPILQPAPGVSSYGAPWIFGLDDVPNAYSRTSADYPNVLGIRPSGKWGPVPRNADSDETAGWINACEVDADASWGARRRLVTNQGKVSYLYALDVATAREVRLWASNVVPPAPGRAPVTRSRVTETLALVSAPNSPSATLANAQALTRLLVPPPATRSGWAPQSFHWAPRGPLGYAPPLFPDHGAAVDSVARTLCYVRPYTIYDINDDWNVSVPATRRLTALMTSVALTIADGALAVDFTMSPAQVAYAPDSSGAAQWRDIPAGVPRWADLDPAVSWADLASVGRP